jgi:16S rRNA (cytidine1402-2'-O)-methyltransferase
VLAETLQDLVTYYSTHVDKQKGEVVILVTGVDEEERGSKEVIPAEVLDILLEELPLKQATSLASKITGERKNILYELALAKKKM